VTVFLVCLGISSPERKKNECSVTRQDTEHQMRSERIVRPVELIVQTKREGK
jgi:hypothetical protein